LGIEMEYQPIIDAIHRPESFPNTAGRLRRTDTEELFTASMSSASAARARLPVCPPGQAGVALSRGF
jgi:hypothetical protein